MVCSIFVHINICYYVQKQICFCIYLGVNICRKIIVLQIDEGKFISIVDDRFREPTRDGGAFRE